MIDLAYSSLLLNSRELAEEVQALEERIDNLNTVFQEPFDENTVLDANVIYQLARMIALSFSYNRTFKYNDETGIYDPIDSFGITTIFTFF